MCISVRRRERKRERVCKSEGALSNKESPESAAEQFSPQATGQDYSSPLPPTLPPPSLSVCLSLPLLLTLFPLVLLLPFSIFFPLSLFLSLPLSLPLSYKSLLFMLFLAPYTLPLFSCCNKPAPSVRCELVKRVQCLNKDILVRLNLPDFPVYQFPLFLVTVFYFPLFFYKICGKLSSILSTRCL